MKTLSKEELQEQAKAYFEKYGVKKLYGVSDGQIFLLESRAKAHAGDRNVYTLEAETTVEAQKEATTEQEIGLTVTQLKVFVAKESDLNVLNEILLKEVGGLNRKGAVAAITERMDKLAEEPKTDATEGSQADTSKEGQTGTTSGATNTEKTDSQESKGEGGSDTPVTV
jgi:hypothetical protein